MRIGVIHRSLDRLGGAESYLEKILGLLAQRGHEVAFLREREPLGNGPRIAVPAGISTWTLGGDGLARLERWNPDVLYVHMVSDPTLEKALSVNHPSVHLAHAYHGMCASGAKFWKFPSVRTCGRTLGLGCLVHFYPHRCGGLSPVTLAREFRLQLRRRDNLRRYGAVVTLSEHMRREVIRHGVGSDHVFRIVPGVEPVGDVDEKSRPRSPWKILFAGRFSREKGGDWLLRALPIASAGLGAQLEVTCAGDGLERGRWEKLAAKVREQGKGISIRFLPWRSPEALRELLAECHLLAFPSLWPEPFGLLGLEAAAAGVPAVAFGTGGIAEWLVDGETGSVAPAEGDRAEGLARAILRCLESPDSWERLSQGARRRAATFTWKAHVEELLGVLRERSARPPTA